MWCAWGSCREIDPHCCHIRWLCSVRESAEGGRGGTGSEDSATEGEGAERQGRGAVVSPLLSKLGLFLLLPLWIFPRSRGVLPCAHSRVAARNVVSMAVPSGGLLLRGGTSSWFLNCPGRTWFRQPSLFPWDSRWWSVSSG